MLPPSSRAPAGAEARLPPPRHPRGTFTRGCSRRVRDRRGQARARPRGSAKLGAGSTELRRPRRPGACSARRRVPRRLSRVRRSRCDHGAAPPTRCRRRPARGRRLQRSWHAPYVGSAAEGMYVMQTWARSTLSGTGGDWCASSPPPSLEAPRSAAFRRRSRRLRCSSRRSPAPTARAGRCSSSYAKHASRTASSAASASTSAGTGRRG